MKQTGATTLKIGTRFFAQKVMNLLGIKDPNDDVLNKLFIKSDEVCPGSKKPIFYAKLPFRELKERAKKSDLPRLHDDYKLSFKNGNLDCCSVILDLIENLNTLLPIKD